MDRRKFIKITAAGSGAIASLPLITHAERLAKAIPQSINPDIGAPSFIDAAFIINGRKCKFKIDARTTLLDLLREKAELTGTKKGCDHGQCGACTVIVNGKRMNSCLSLAVQNQNKEILTIEGLANGTQLHPMQQAFIDQDAFQCGFCTPGQILSAVSLLNEKCGTSENEVRECMSGNICRCGAYPNILAAIAQVRKSGDQNASI